MRRKDRAWVLIRIEQACKLGVVPPPFQAEICPRAGSPSPAWTTANVAAAAFAAAAAAFLVAAPTGTYLRTGHVHSSCKIPVPRPKLGRASRCPLAHLGAPDRNNLGLVGRKVPSRLARFEP